MWRGLAILLSLIVGGCNAPKDPRIQLRYMAWGSVEQLAIEQRIVDEFNKRNPDIHVRLFKVPGSSYRNKMVVMFASRTAPDVVRVDHYDFPQLAQRNYFMDLERFVAADTEFKLSDFYPLAVEECRVGGRLQGLNVLFGGGIMFYNKKILAEEGLEDPNKLWERGEWTYDKVLEYARKCTKYDANGRPLQFGINMPPMPFYIGVLQAFGAKLFNEDLDTCLLDSPEAIAAMQWIADLRWKYRCAPSPAQGANFAFDFETGKQALRFDYIGMSARYRGVVDRFDWDICPMPLGPKGDSFFVKGNQLVMYRETKQPDAAWRFMKFVTGPEAERIMYIEMRRQSPTRIALAESDDFLRPRERPFNMKAVALTVERGKVLPIGPRWPEVMQTLSPQLDNLFSGRVKDAAAAMKQTAAAVNKLLAEDPGL